MGISIRYPVCRGFMWLYCIRLMLYEKAAKSSVTLENVVNHGAADGCRNFQTEFWSGLAGVYLIHSFRTAKWSKLSSTWRPLHGCYEPKRSPRTTAVWEYPARLQQKRSDDLNASKRMKKKDRRETGRAIGADALFPVERPDADGRRLLRSAWIDPVAVGPGPAGGGSRGN
jgi:hypothetical protein